MTQKEKKNANKLMKEIVKEIGGWYERIVDTPYGRYANKKPFDGVLTFGGCAFEFKFKEGGKTFNLDSEWRNKEPYQEIGLRQFEDSGSGYGILLIFWKRKNRIHVCWKRVTDLIGKHKIPFSEWHDKASLFSLLKGGEDG